MSDFHIRHLAIVGVGLIGGSLALALRQAGAVQRITGVGRNLANLQRAKALGVIDDFVTEFEDMDSPDVIVLAVPLGAMRAMMEKLKPFVSETTVLTDVGSAKQSILKDAEAVFGAAPVNMVPGHPIAGNEKHGVEAAFKTLFDQRRVILTPHAHSAAQATSTVRQMWEACGAEVVEMNATHHDEVLAATSHLPHMLAYALVDTLARMDDSQEIFDFAAGGFRDFTRIASSDPQMWHDICVANREALVEVLRAFNEDLHRLTEAVEQGDGEFLKETFTRAKAARDQFCG